MGSLFIVPLMMGFCLAEPLEADRPLLTVAPDAKVTLRQVKVGDQYYVKVQTGGVSFVTAKLRLDIGATSPFEVDAVANGVRVVLQDNGRKEILVMFEPHTFVGLARTLPSMSDVSLNVQPLSWASAVVIDIQFAGVFITLRSNRASQATPRAGSCVPNTISFADIKKKAASSRRRSRRKGQHVRK